MHKLPLLLALLLTSATGLFAQTLIINEVSQGEMGNQEYVEFLVIDTSAAYNCSSTTPPCIDIRGWIFDDNSGYHGSSGIAAGCLRFSFDPLWQCVPLGTIILVYNDADTNPLVATIGDDLSTSDGNCNITAPISNPNLFEQNTTTPGAAACSYPTNGWTPGGIWSNTAMANSSDCARIVDLAGCEVFSVCWNANNQNNLIYFSGSASNTVYYFNGNDPEDQTNWSSGCSDVPACGIEEQTPGTANNPTNAAYIAQFNNYCNPITPVVATITSSNDSGCNCDGDATVSGSGSIPGYTYAWYDNTFTSINQTGPTATNLCAGVYNVIVTSSVGCSDTATVSIASSGGSGQVIPSFTSIAPVCQNSSIPALPNTSTNAITGTWSPTVSTATPGTTTYTFTPDAGQCATNATLDITVNPLNTPSFDPIASLCQNDPSPVLPTTSTNAITGTWSPSINTTLLGTTTYTFTPTTGQCANSSTLDITVNAAANIIQNITVCEGENHTYPDGTISNNITSAESHISNLTSSLGCDSIITTNVSVNPTQQISTNIPICHGSNYTYIDGTVSNNITSNESHSSLLVSSTGCDSSVIENLVVGTSLSSTENISACENQNYVYPDGSSEIITANTSHNSTLTSSNGCDSIITTNVTMIASYSFTENITICENESYTFPDGTVETISSNTTHTSHFNNFLGCDSIITTNIAITPISTITENINVCEGDNYTFPDGTISNNITINETHTSVFSSLSGCDSTIITQINVISLPFVNAGPDLVICGGEPVTLSANSSTGNSVNWNNGILDGIPFTPTTDQTYSVTVTSAEGCVNTDQVEISLVEGLDPIFIGDSLFGCSSLTVSFSNLSQGGPFTNCTWDFGDGTILSQCEDVEHTYTQAGVYSVSLTIENNSGCSGSITLDDYINISSDPIASFYSNTSQLNTFNTQIDLINQSINADSYVWDFGDTSNVVTEENPSHTYPSVVDNYDITLIANNSNGCSDTTSLSFSVVDVLIYYVPNTFTPDGDEFNNDFKPIFHSGHDPYDYKLLIFNRWGNVLFESNNAEIGWDGTYNGKLLSDNVFTWRLEFQEKMTDKRHIETGHVTLLK